MSGRKEVDELIREARKLGLTAERKGWKWEITGPHSKVPVVVAVQGVGHSLSGVRSDMRKLIEPPTPMAAAFTSAKEPTADELTERAFRTWDIGSLLKAAEGQGITWHVSGGVVSVVGPPEAEAMARLIRDRAGEILAFLKPPTEEVMPEIREMATINRTTPAPARDLTSDAYGLWEIVRDLAKVGGDKPGANAGVEGVLWQGALDRLMREACPDWDPQYRQDVGSYLNRSGHMHCQSKYAKPDPIWWVRNTWDDGGLKVSKAKPTPKALARPAAKEPEPVNGSAASAAGGALAFLQQMDARMAAAEQRADAADAVIVELEAERDAAVARAEKAEGELETINALFARFSNGTP